VIAVSSPHRKEAFVACESILEGVKRKAQIWKREYYEGEQEDEAEWKTNEWLDDVNSLRWWACQHQFSRWSVISSLPYLHLPCLIYWNLHVNASVWVLAVKSKQMLLSKPVSSTCYVSQLTYPNGFISFQWIYAATTSLIHPGSFAGLSTLSYSLVDADLILCTELP